MRWLLNEARKRDIEPTGAWTVASVAVAMYTTLPVNARDPLWYGILAVLVAGASLVFLFIAPYIAIEQVARERGQWNYSYRATYLWVRGYLVIAGVVFLGNMMATTFGMPTWMDWAISFPTALGVAIIGQVRIRSLEAIDQGALDDIV